MVSRGHYLDRLKGDSLQFTVLQAESPYANYTLHIIREFLLHYRRGMSTHGNGW